MNIGNQSSLPQHQMPTVARSALVACSAPFLFELVDAVEQYPHFLPWCGGARVLSRDESMTVATLDIRYAGVTQSFTTENRKEGGQRMTLALREGPFKQLSGYWQFTPLSQDGCKVELMLDYQFSNRVLEQAVGPVFGMISTTLVDCFVERAEAVKGDPNAFIG